MISRLRWYPVVLFICWLAATIQRFYTNFYYYGHEDESTVMLVHFIFDTIHMSLMCSRGTMLFLAYVKTNNFRVEANEVCLFFCCKEQPNKIKQSSKSISSPLHKPFNF